MKKILINLSFALLIAYWGWRSTGFEAHHFESSSQLLIYGIWATVFLYLVYQVIVDILKIIKK